MLSYRKLGVNIQKARLRRGLTQETVATSMGLTQNYYGRYERGEVRPSLNRLYEICVILSTPIEEMFRGTYDPKEFDEPLPPDMTVTGISRLIGGCSPKHKAVMYQLCEAIAALERDDVE